MSPVLVMVYYCAAVMAASLFGGSIPHWIRLTHTRMQLALSFVAGVILGVGLLHLIPHAYIALAQVSEETAIDRVVWWAMMGFLVMFFLERFFHFHHHEAPAEDSPHDVDVCMQDHDHEHDHAAHSHGHEYHPRPKFAWTGALIGMTFHGLMDGIALAAAVQIDSEHGHAVALVGIGTFLAVFLHKPFDALTIGTLMAASGWPAKTRHIVNAAYTLITPLGMGLFFLGVKQLSHSQNDVLGCILGFAGGAFLCIATSDLLPELQFHAHDRFKLSLALLLGVALAWGIVFVENGGHDHHHHAEHATPQTE